jgi:hypothetical protein
MGDLENLRISKKFPAKRLAKPETSITISLGESWKVGAGRRPLFCLIYIWGSGWRIANKRGR